MKRLVAALAVAGLLVAAVAFSRPDREDPLRLKQEARNPWTSLKLNSAPGDFQFAIVSDRTGSHRAKVFSRAVARLNLLQPEFVVSVGDLIEGGNKSEKTIAAEWEEFDGYVKKLTMPFFYVPGNHDTGNKKNDGIWEQRLGRRHYHFVYRDVLFLCLNTDDHEDESGAPRLGKSQVAYAKKALADNKDVRWTLVFLHKPIWTATDLKKRGWADVEEALKDRPYTVFCGHVHRYQKFVRQGRNYYQLATTGGGSRMRGVSYGEFDHLVWVTMKKDGPVLANVMLDSILPDDLKVPASDEKGLERKRFKTHPVRGTVYYDGSPVVGAQVAFSWESDKRRRTTVGVARTEADGSFVVSTYGPFDGAPAAKYTVTVTLRGMTAKGRPGPNLLPAKYATAEKSPLKVEIKEGGGEVKLELEK
jgi:3',5'-cyclic AMP phosphodiesterase CpdA